MNRRNFIQTGSIAFSLTATGSWAFDFSPDNDFGNEYSNLIPFRKEPRNIKEEVAGFLWADAADFQTYGGWALDTQFVGFMGSSYLLSHGGRVVKDAQLKLKAVQPGKYRLWVRSKNWIPEHSPGTFGVGVNGKDTGKTFGAQAEEGWTWQDGGVHELAGATTLKLQDKSGMFGRCSSLILTRDLSYHPPKELQAFKNERARLSGVSNAVQRGKSYDVIVVGAGPAGVPAALAAARSGARTALISNRPVLGGNASAEIGVPVQGAAKKHRGVPVRETGIIEEAARIMLKELAENQPKIKGPYTINMSKSFAVLSDAEPNLDVYDNCWLDGVDKEGAAKISTVIMTDTLTGARTALTGAMFIDCSGNAWVGHHAGADERIGREAKSEYNEQDAPDVADGKTMSGALRGQCVNGRHNFFYRTKKLSAPQPFTTPPWIYKLPEEGWETGRGNTEQLLRVAMGGTWWLEHPGDVDDVFDPERARDELIRVNYSFWDYMKNQWSERGRLRNYVMDYTPFTVGTREGRRLMGDYVMNANDALESRTFDDVIAHSGWSLDVHHMDGILSTEGPNGPNRKIPLGQIPYRCLYSRNIDNLLMAGRCASVTHEALGTVRIEASCAVTGQAAGTAAAIALKHKTTPRGVYKKHLKELQQQLVKDDQCIPGMVNEDPGDLARGATITASSERASAPASNLNNGISRPSFDGKVTNGWESKPSQPLPQWVELKLDRPASIGAIQCTFDTNLEGSHGNRTNPLPKECVRDYTLECKVDGQWVRVARVRDNIQRFRRHAFKQVKTDRVRLTVEATQGAETARVFEMRVYPDAAPILKG